MLEYLYPLMTEDSYLMEHLVVQFLHDIQKESTEKLNEATLNTIEIAFTQE